MRINLFQMCVHKDVENKKNKTKGGAEFNASIKMWICANNNHFDSTIKKKNAALLAVLPKKKQNSK